MVIESIKWMKVLLSFHEWNVWCLFSLLDNKSELFAKNYSLYPSDLTQIEDFKQKLTKCGVDFSYWSLISLELFWNGWSLFILFFLKQSSYFHICWVCALIYRIEIHRRASIFNCKQLWYLLRLQLRNVQSKWSIRENDGQKFWGNFNFLGNRN